MKTIVPRTCTVIPIGDEKRNPVADSRPLSELRDAPAYVLLGDPGMGKTTAFETECDALGENACKVDARDFLALDIDMHPEWHSKALYIDGLDEVRAGAANASTPFDEIRNRLERLGRPRFRLSCREADWLGENDWKRLTTVSPGSSVTVLRLDPLGEADILRVLSAQEGIEDPQLFIDNARERRIDGLLQNPLTLELLATVIARGEQWPESRLQTFEHACLHLVREHNTEHKVAGQHVKTNQLLDAAGRLCAVQLISGIDGYTHGTGDPQSDFPALEEIENENPDALNSVLSTKLFKAESSSLNRFGPIHRHVAEYLGARYLAHLIEEGLPASRILSLVTGEDGIVVTGLRGMSAWLAAYCKNARSVLIEQDPVGVGLYGDIRGFTLEKKQALLKALNREASRLGSIEIAPAFGPLATSEMEPALKDVLSNSSRESEHQKFVEFTLNILCEGRPLQGLSGILLDIVRDNSRWPGVNASALHAFIHCEDRENGIHELKILLKGVTDGSVSDPDNELLGILLTRLYPCYVLPGEIWEYLTETRETDSIGAYWWFWEHELLEGSSDQQIVELLDAMQHRLPDLRSALEGRLHLERLPSRLLARVLPSIGESSDIKRLYDWLNAGFSETFGVRRADKNAIREIGSWLQNRPELLKKLFVEGLNRCPESDEFRYHAFKARDRLYGAAMPADFGLWCLSEAIEMAATKPQIAEHLLELAWRCHSRQGGHDGLSLELLVNHVSKNEVLMTRLAQLRGHGETLRADRVEDRDRSEERYIDRRRRLEEEWLDHLRANETALRENLAAPALLTEIAARYFSDSINYSSASGPREFEQDLGRDRNLIDAIRLGICGVVEREDVPDVDEILALKKKGQAHYIGWPFVAALAEIEKSTPDVLCRLDDEQIRKALAFHYCSENSHEPDWYRRLCDTRPDVVAETMVRCGIPELRSGNGAVSGLFGLPRSRELAQVAKLASLPLLRAFPTRCNAAQIEALNNLLWAALRYADRTLLKELIDRKLAAKSMNVAQRVHWLAAAVVLSPEPYIDPLIDYVHGREMRVRYLIGFFPSVVPRAGFSLSDVELEVPVLEVLVRLIGSYFRPYVSKHGREDDWNVSANTNAELVHAFIRRLAVSQSKDACVALDTLLEDNTLSAWRDVLSRERDSQRVFQRDANYRHPQIEHVCRTLDGGSPANAADLAALMNDHLHEIARNIHDGNTSDWWQYWDSASDSNQRKPRHEELCRDAILSDLKYKSTPLTIDAQPEGRYADQKRADIRVSFEGFNVPIEIKKNSHPDLWTAIKTQLIAKYTRDPGASGHGIYLVFWFGSEHTTFPPSGSRPETPDKLREQLQASLSDVEARRISVVVIDVSGEESDSE